MAENTTSMTIQQAREFAAGLFREGEVLEKGVYARCDTCYGKWRKNGSNPEDKPPQFPASYKGNCPVCDSPLKAHVPF